MDAEKDPGASASSGLPVLCLLGPTAVGKSALAMALATAGVAGCKLELVSVDSGQVYRGMDIGTAKPGPAEQAQVSHHLIDLLDPEERYSAGRFRQDALNAISAIHARGHVPLLVGGTMLYYRALVQGLDALPAADPAMRAAIDAQAAQLGWPALHAQLAREDPQTASRLAPNDAQRIQRALEVLRLTGQPLSSLQTHKHNEPGLRSALPFPMHTFALVPSDRAWLHGRIEARFDAMLAGGFLEEVEALRRRPGLHADLPSMRCVGYRQIWDFLDGRSSRTEMHARGIAATRQLAKRQLTWLRSLPKIETLDPVALTTAALANALRLKSGW